MNKLRNKEIKLEMSFQVKEPVLVIGIGGVGSKLAIQAKESLNSDCLLISNDKNDLSQENPSVHVSTDSVVNPSVQLIRGSIYKVKDEIESKISSYSTVILMSNLAGKAGSAMAPVVSKMCKESDNENPHKITEMIISNFIRKDNRRILSIRTVSMIFLELKKIIKFNGRKNF